MPHKRGKYGLKCEGICAFLYLFVARIGGSQYLGRAEKCGKREGWGWGRVIKYVEEITLLPRH